MMLLRTNADSTSCFPLPKVVQVTSLVVLVQAAQHVGPHSKAAATAAAAAEPQSADGMDVTGVSATDGAEDEGETKSMED